MAGWPRNDLTDLLGIEHPIIQAPMASAATPALAAAVSNAGGLGSLGCAPFTPEQFRDQVGTVRADTNRPFNVNFFVHDEPLHDADAETAMRAHLAPYYSEMALGEAPAHAFGFSDIRRRNSRRRHGTQAADRQFPFWFA